MIEHCPNCFSDRLANYGHYLHRGSMIVRLICQSCGRVSNADGSGAFGNTTPPDQVKQIREAYAEGLGYRSVARVLGVSTNTLKRLELFGVVKPGICQCGAPATHRGWCAHRYAKSAARQAFIEGWCPSGRVFLRWPYVGREDELLKTIASHAPEWWPEQVKADACQETAMLLLDGSFALSQIKEAMREGSRRVYAMFPVHKGAPRSLSETRSEDDNRELSGRMMAWQSFSLGEIVRGHNGGTSPIKVESAQIVDEIDPDIAEVMRLDMNPQWFRPLNNS